MKKRIDWIVLIISLISVYTVAIIGSMFTSMGMEGMWYESVRTIITPPDWVFPIVWNILFFLIALSLYFAWTKSNKKQKLQIAIVFGLNFALNILWTVFFFAMQNPTLSFYEIIVLLSSIFVMISVTRRINKISTYLLIPYLLWVSFAGFLNYLIAF